MLVQNGSRSVSSSCVFPRGGAVSILRGWWGRNTLRNISVGQGITDKKCAIPDGNRHPNAWLLATKSGALAARNTADGSSTFTSAITGGRNAVAGLTGQGNITNAALGLIVDAVCAIAGSGTLSASIVGKLEAVAALAGQGDLTAALGALASVVSNLTGSGTVSAAMTAQGSLSADINVTGGTLTTSNVAFYVWSALASAFNTPGTFGAEVLKDSDITKIADIILRRSTANVEASSEGDALALRSLYGMIAQAVHNTQVSGTTLSVTQSNDTTVLGTRTVTLDPNAQPITGLNSD
jgi:hypothetical protein